MGTGSGSRRTQRTSTIPNGRPTGVKSRSRPTPPRSHTVCGVVHRRPADAKSCWYQRTRCPRLNGRRTEVQSSTPARKGYGFDRLAATRSRVLFSRESSRRKLPPFRRTADGSHTAPTARAGATRFTSDCFHREKTSTRSRSMEVSRRGGEAMARNCSSCLRTRR